MRYPAAPGNAHRFKTLVRVHTHPTGMFGWPYVPGFIVIQHQKGTQVVPQILPDKIAYFKPISHHVRRSGCAYLFYFFVIHVFLFGVYCLGFIVGV
jgi:hypothetical protein